MIVVDHTTGEVLAHVGSAGLSRRRPASAPSTWSSAVRSPGSTLKPFIYGLAFEAGLAHPETLIEDRPTRFGIYAPKNFDEDFHGTVTMREALAQSLNIPAVKVLAAVGPGKLVGRFRRVGRRAGAARQGAEPTLAIALGGLGMTLRRSRRALCRPRPRRRAGHAHLASRDATSRQGAPEGTPAVRSARLLSPVAAWYVTDILKDAPPPPNAKGGRIAYKTGTSYGYRDAWAVGYDGRHTIAVWVGRPDGAATPGLIGRTAAAPMLFDAFARLGDRRAPLRRARPPARCRSPAPTCRRR